MVLHLLPDSICGRDTDEIFAYTTPKVCWVRDRYIGFCYYCLIFLALCWVVGGQILWRNEHFQLKDVHGIPRMWVSHPTRNQCDPNSPACLSDFKSLVDLPYCNEGGGVAVARPASCVFADKHTLLPDGGSENKLFLPTSVVVMTERRSCHPSASNGYTCNNEYEKEWGASQDYLHEDSMSYYANIEDYVVQFTSSYHREYIEGTSLDHPGSYFECQEARPQGKRTWEQRLEDSEKQCADVKKEQIKCIGDNCFKGGVKVPTLEETLQGAKALNVIQLGSTSPHMLNNKRHMRGHGLVRRQGEEASMETVPGAHSFHAQEEYRPTPDVYASPYGDTFKIGKLMQLAGIDLDNHYNMDGSSTRMAGTVLEVEIQYSNIMAFISSFGWSQVQYSYKVSEKRLPYVSREMLTRVQPADYPESRQFMVQHGILMVFTTGGQFGFFSIVYLLLMLTTSLALFATAHRVTDLASIYIHPRKNNYFHLKYDVSPDFSDMWECPKCKFLNHEKDQYCCGADRWKCVDDVDEDGNTPVCGEPRPRNPHHPRDD